MHKTADDPTAALSATTRTLKSLKSFVSLEDLGTIRIRKRRGQDVRGRHMCRRGSWRVL